MSLPDDDVLAASIARSRAVAQAWRESPAWTRTAAAFAAASRAEDVAGAAKALFSDDDWLCELTRPLLSALDADPWFDPPLRVRRSAGAIGAVLFRNETVSIAAQVLRPLPASPSTVALSGRVSVIRCIAGRGRLLLHHVDGAAEDRTISAGDMREIDGRTSGYALAPIGGDLAMLTATAAIDAAPLAREIRLEDGATLRTATTDDRAARSQLLLAFLCADGRRDAGDCFAAATRDPAWFLRWDAMREWLALDAASAWPRLAEMAADDPHGEVRAAAAATLGLLAERKAA